MPDDGSSGTSSGSEGNKENNPVVATSGLTRRQKKNHRIRRTDDTNHTLGNMVKKKQGSNHARPKTSPGPGATIKSQLGLPDFLLIQYFQHYLIRLDQLFWLGFPVESSNHPGRAVIFKQSGESVFSLRPFNNFFTTSLVTTPLISQSKGFDINAREFVPKDYTQYNINYGINNSNNNNNNNNNNNCLNYNNNYINSGVNGYSDCLTSNCDIQKKSPTGVYDSTTGYHQVVLQHRKKCVRCMRPFYVTQLGEYLTREQCLYHWGRLNKQFHERDSQLYSCCHGKKESKGCTTAKLHVWSGLEDDVINGPLEGYVRTRHRKTPPPDGSNGLYAIDCEMCFTTQGLELAKVTVIGVDGRIVYDTLVKPENEIIDYNTRFSGITPKDMSRRTIKVLRDVQNDLMGFINADTILLGHGMENDLRALKMIHTTVVDTAVVFPHYCGLPYRRSLKSLVECFLNRAIQTDSGGHNSVEDATSCLELMLWKMKSDLGSNNNYMHNHVQFTNNRL